MREPKVLINNNAFVYPMPMILVGTMVAGKANFMPVGWVSRVNATPPMIAIALGNRHFTNQGITEHQCFSINIPSREMLIATDYCGLVTGSKIDKSNCFEIFYGKLERAPMINDCPVCMECKLISTTDLPTNTLFIGEIINAYSEEQYLTAGKPDINKIHPFVLTMPDNNYWEIGANVGKAWSAGKDFAKNE